MYLYALIVASSLFFGTTFTMEEDNPIIRAIHENIDLVEFQNMLTQEKPSVEALNQALLYCVSQPIKKITISYVECLSYAGADINAQTEDGSTPLILVAGNKDNEDQNVLELLKFLTDCDPDVNAQRDDGSTALLLAVENAERNGCFNLVQRLLLSSVDATIKNSAGRSPESAAQNSTLKYALACHQGKLPLYKAFKKCLKCMHCDNMCGNVIYFFLTNFFCGDAANPPFPLINSFTKKKN